MVTFSSSGPDQAIGWLVAFACFVINFLMAGIARSVGVMYVALISGYGVGREEAAKPFSTRISVRCIVGPIVGLLGQRYGIRNVTATGSIVAALGSILCFFAPNVFWITMFWGVLHGIGFGLGNVLHMLAIGPYFDKHKASALGFGFAGESFGAFIFPVVIELLLSEYDVKGMFLIIGGLMLNVFPMALLLKKPPWLKHQNSLKTLRANKCLQHECVEHQRAGQVNRAFEDSEKDITEKAKCNCNLKQKNCIFSESHNSLKISDEIIAAPRSVKNIICSVNGENTGDGVVLLKEASSTNQNILFDDSVEVVAATHSKLKLDKYVSAVDIEDTEQTLEGNILNFKNEKSSSTLHPTHDVEDKIRSASFVSLDGCSVLINSESKDVDVQNGLSNTFANGIGKSILLSFLRINIKPLFNLISLNLAAVCYLFVGLLTVNIDYASDHGISINDSKFFVIGYSIADLLGRLSFGQILDRKILAPKTYALVTWVLSGIVVAAIPISRNYYYIMVCMCTCGFIVGAAPMIFPILITTYMEKDEETVAFGCLNFMEGIIMLLMAPMIGHFRDNIGSYDGVFYISGVFEIIAGALWLFEPLLLKFEGKMFPKKELQSLSTNL
ncbi:monocarboxylate transporter 9-like [Uloborus diversus]|uniref:monocarboxylate transporter 9-like n=1 Tax=Uloborus diversus TaxID=327109 RepID=UPI00240903E3|nr:monocarboxylate transporter 9-like [Uloborus diversus]